MALTGKTNEEKIWNFLASKGLNAFGVAGLMGNLYAESALNPPEHLREKARPLGRGMHRSRGLWQLHRLRA